MLLYLARRLAQNAVVLLDMSLLPKAWSCESARPNTPGGAW